VVIRPAGEHDLGSIRRISLATGQPEIGSGADPAYLDHLRSSGTVLVADDQDGQAVAWGAEKPVGRASLLTDLFVDPTHQGEGLGSALLRELWPDRSDAAPRFTFSSQHPAALPIYTRAGLSPLWPLLYLSGAPDRLPPGRAIVEHVSTDVAARIERDMTGSDRTPEYRYWLQQGAAGLVVRVADEIVGVGAGAPGELAHLACPPESAANEVVGASLQALGPSRAQVCVPGPHPALAVLLAAGYSITDYDIYMSNRPDLLASWWIYSPGLA
jgi:GNAT superfamily N-acetyltransferase